MANTKIKALAIVGMVGGLAGVALAQSLPSAMGRYDPTQFPEVKGVVGQYSLSPRGDVEGVILKDGTEVHVPPHLGVQVVSAVKPDDPVSVRGLKARAVAMIDAVQIRNETTGRTVDAGASVAADASTVTMSGRVAQTLHGRRGEVNGALLEDGVIIRMPPHEAARRADLLAPGASVTVAGALVQSSLGKVLDVTDIGASASAMSTLERPAPKGPKPFGPKPLGPKG